MSEYGMYILSIVAGLLLGTFFFGGLWWTIKKGTASKTPAIWFLSSFFIRLGITVCGFYFVSYHHWERMILCLAGFIIARTLITRYTKTLEAKRN